MSAKAVASQSEAAAQKRSIEKQFRSVPGLIREGKRVSVKKLQAVVVDSETNGDAWLWNRQTGWIFVATRLCSEQSFALGDWLTVDADSQLSHYSSQKRCWFRAVAVRELIEKKFLTEVQKTGFNADRLLLHNVNGVVSIVCGKLHSFLVTLFDLSVSGLHTVWQVRVRLE